MVKNWSGSVQKTNSKTQVQENTEMSDDDGNSRLEELEAKKKFGKLCRNEQHELKKLLKAKKSHCMCMGGVRPEVFSIEKK